MTIPGTQRYVEEAENDGLEADMAVSAFRAWQVRENLTHLQNVSTQYRLNWCASRKASAGIPTDTIKHASSDSALRYWAAAFPIAVHEPSQPVSLDIRVAALIQGSTTSIAVSANIVPHRYERSLTGLPVRQALWTGSGNTTSTTGAWVIDEQTTISAAAEPLYREATRIYTSTENGERLPVQLSIMRLELRITGTFTGTGTAHVVGVQVKEYVT